MMSFKILLFVSLAALGFASSEAVSVNFVPVGCYRDNQLNPRPLPDLIHNYRLNDEMDWKDLNSTVIEACAQETRTRGYMYFGIQFYGECWSGPQAHQTYSNDGHSTMCIHGVGRGFANMVYKLNGDENECANYKVLDAENRSVLYKNKAGSDILCDKSSFTPDWYRFQGKAGTRMADTTMQDRCQTQDMIWYPGPYPDVTQGIVPDQKVCLTEDCKEPFITHIKVRNCGGFFVYYLQPMTGCYYRYCGNGEKPAIKANI